MSYDPKLVEAVAKALRPDAWKPTNYRFPVVDRLTIAQSQSLIDAETVLAVIDASGVAWVAPWEATQAMDDAGWRYVQSKPGWKTSEYAAMRDACLAERRAADTSPANAPRTREDESAGVIGHEDASGG